MATIFTFDVLFTNPLVHKTYHIFFDRLFIWVYQNQLSLLAILLWFVLLFVLRSIYLKLKEQTELRIVEQSANLKSQLDPLQELVDRLVIKKERANVKKQTFHQVPNTLQITLREKLRQFEVDKTFVNPAILLDQLAKQMGTNSRYLSLVIREAHDKNFTEYINELRVKEVLHMFEQGMHHKMTLEGLSQLAGFNSRVTFNRAFKKYTGKTPSIYLEELESLV